MPEFRSLSMEMLLEKEFNYVSKRLAEGLDWDQIRKEVIEDDLLQISQMVTRKKYLNLLRRRIQPFDQAFFEVTSSQFEWTKWSNFCGLIISSSLFREVFYELVWSSYQEGRHELTKGQIDEFFLNKRLSSQELMGFSEVTWQNSQRRCLGFFKTMGYFTGKNPISIRYPFVPQVILDWLDNHDYSAIAKLLTLEK